MLVDNGSVLAYDKRDMTGRLSESNPKDSTSRK